MAFFKKTKQTEKTMSYADYEVIEELKAKGTSMTAKDKFDIAERYSHNEFDTEDEERSLSWYITAWNSGYKEALSSIKRYAQKGYIRAMKVVSDTLPADSVDKDAKELFNKVFKYYKKLVDKENCNNGEAFMSVADCYFYGKGTNRNYAEAFKKYSRAADFKYPGANMKVGEMYEFGYGTGVEPRLAFDRYKLAFNEGYEKVSDAIYRLSATSDGWLITSCASFFLEQNEYKKVISILENYVRETKSKYAVGLLGSAYTRTGEKENIEKALEIYRQAALDGDEASGLNLGEIYEAGKLVPQDLEKAVDWYFHSAKNGLSLSIIPLKPPFHYEGLCRIFDLAFEGSDYAVKKIAFCFFDGFGTDVDHEKASLYFKKLADKGDAESIEMLKKIERIKQEKFKKELDKKKEPEFTELKFELAGFEGLDTFDYVDSTVTCETVHESGYETNVVYDSGLTVIPSYTDMSIDIATGIYNPDDDIISDNPGDFYIDVSDM